MPFGEERRDDWIEASKGPGEVGLCVIRSLEERRGCVEVPVLQQKNATNQNTNTWITMTTQNFNVEI